MVPAGVAVSGWVRAGVVVDGVRSWRHSVRAAAAWKDTRPHFRTITGFSRPLWSQRAACRKFHGGQPVLSPARSFKRPLLRLGAFRIQARRLRTR